MSTSSAQPAAFSLNSSLIGCPITERLGKSNFSLWKMQVLSAIRGTQLEHYLDPMTAVTPPKTVPKSVEKPDELVQNRDYATWYAKDQQIFNYLVSSVSKEVLVQVSMCTSSAELWKAIHDMTASRSHGHIINTHMALATAQKGASSMQDYFNKMKSLSNDMAAAGKRLEDEELASYILAGLDSDCNPVVSTIGMRVEPLTLGELYTQLISWEQRLDLNNGGFESSVNSAFRGGRGNKGGNKGANRERGGRGRGNNGGGNSGRHQ